MSSIASDQVLSLYHKKNKNKKKKIEKDILNK